MAGRDENCLIVVAGGIGAVTNSIIAGILDEVGKGEIFAEVYGATHGAGGLMENRIADLGAQKRKTVEALRRTPGSILSGRVRSDLDIPTLLTTLRARSVGTLFIIGGLEMVHLAQKVAEGATAAGHELQVLGIPSSAENDVPGGDHTPGYGSAARFVATSARDAGRAADSSDEPITVLEVPGAKSGWLAAAAALARDKESTRENSAPHAIVFPERPVDAEAVVDEVRRAYQKHGYAVAVTTESSRATDGSPLHGHALADLLVDKIGVSTRHDRPGSLVRLNQNSIARGDSDEAYNLGSLAVRLAGDECTAYYVLVQRDLHSAERGEKGYRAIDGTARFDQITDKPRQLPTEYIAENGLNVSQAFLDWARPLVGGALPEYASLSDD